jgi:hypothetical protein
MKGYVASVHINSNNFFDIKSLCKIHSQNLSVEGEINASDLILFNKLSMKIVDIQYFGYSVITRDMLHDFK